MRLRDWALCLLVFLATLCVSSGAWIIKRPATGGGGAGLIASDNFDSYGNPSSLDDAANWTTDNGSILVTTARYHGNASAAYSASRYTGLLPSANHRVEVTIAAVASGTFAGIAVRMNSGPDYYAVFWNTISMYLQRIDNGTAATTMQSDEAISPQVGWKVALEASGTGSATRLKVQLDTGSGWVDKWASTDPTVYLDGGYGGVATYGDGNVNAADDWKLYNL